MTKNFQSVFDTVAKAAGVGIGFAIPISNALTNVCVIILLLAWLLSGVKQKIHIIYKSRITWAILFLLLLYLVGVTYSIAEVAEIKLMLHKMSRLLLIPILMSLFTEARWRQYALYSFLLAIVFSLCVVAIKYSSFSLNTIFLKNYFLKLSHFFADERIAFKDRIFTSLFFSYSIFILLNLLYNRPNFIKDEICIENSLLSIKKIFIYGLIMLNFVYLFGYCEGRSGQLLCLLLIEMLIIQQRFNWKKMFIANVVLCICIASVFCFAESTRDRYVLTIEEFVGNNAVRVLFGLPERNEHSKELQPLSHQSTGLRLEFLKNSLKIVNEHSKELQPLSHQSTGLRLEFLKNSLKIVKKSPLLGYGTGSFRHVYNENYPLYDEYGDRLYVKNPHNQYILIAVELGLVGFFALALMLIILLYEGCFLPNLEKFLLQGLMLSIIIGCLANSWLMDFPSMHYFVYFAGVLFAAYPFQYQLSLSSTAKRPKLC